MLAGGKMLPTRVWILALSNLAPQPSQKLISSRCDEVNVVTHYWIHGSESARWGSDELTESITIGAVACQCIEELYADHKDGGLPCLMTGPAPSELPSAFKPATRSVAIHGSTERGIALSPNNCQFGLVAPAGQCAAMVVLASRTAPAAARVAADRGAVPAPAEAATEPAASSSAASPEAVQHNDSAAAICVVVLPKDAAADKQIEDGVRGCDTLAQTLRLLSTIARESQKDGAAHDAVSVASVLDHLQSWACAALKS
jgi:hypothetical protein